MYVFAASQGHFAAISHLYHYLFLKNMPDLRTNKLTFHHEDLAFLFTQATSNLIKMAIENRTPYLGLGSLFDLAHKIKRSLGNYNLPTPALYTAINYFFQ
ncbi:MAG TPA: hypothetical protein VHZ76_07750 [Gammaproteobacteria bacterium]|jgi:hypothetical protein|nr:hypothetical protein [Gammaproteobacteria bacterium]